jgi:hypothetical protein
MALVLLFQSRNRSTSRIYDGLKIGEDVIPPDRQDEENTILEQQTAAYF